MIALMQSKQGPLANPKQKAYKQSKNESHYYNVVCFDSVGFPYALFYACLMVYIMLDLL